MLGQVISMVVPKVIGYKITGSMNPIATSTDVVLTITKVSCVRNFYVIAVSSLHKLSACPTLGAQQ